MSKNSMFRLRARLGGLATSSRHDGREQTAAARGAFLQRFIDEVDPDRSLPEDERLRRADAARRAYFTKLALKSAITRRRVAARKPAR
jgi:hypothetical protein